MLERDWGSWWLVDIVGQGLVEEVECVVQAGLTGLYA